MNPHAPQSASPIALIKSLWTHRALIAALTRREVEGRYRGSVFGLFWSFLNPILALTVFTFVFGEIFQARWAGATTTGGVDFAAALFSGLLIYNFFSECLGKAPTLVLLNANYVKKVVFPLEVLGIVNVLSALFHLLAAYLILIGLILLSTWTLSWHAALVPLVMLPFVLMVTGLCWGLSALGVYLRDIGQIIAPVLTAMLFLSPVFYPLSSVAPHLQKIYALNPVTTVIEQVRGLLLYHTLPDWRSWLLYAAVALITAILGYAFFQKSRSGFADVI